MNTHPFAHTLVCTHNMCKAKTLLTALNKLLNHLFQIEGLEKCEWARRRKRFPSQAKCHHKCIVFQSENLESKSHLPRDARGLLSSAICNFKYISKDVCASVCVCVCVCVCAICEFMYVREKFLEKRNRDGSKGLLRRGSWKKDAITFSASF